MAGVAVAVAVVGALPALAGTVEVYDDSHVLDVTRVQNEAGTLPDPVAVYTTTKSASDNAAFDREAQAKVTGPNAIVIAINTQSHHLAIRSGNRSGISQSAAQAASGAFKNSIVSGNSDYTAATVAALDSLRGSVHVQPGGGAGAPARQTESGGSVFGGILVLILIVAVLGVVGWLIAKGRRRVRRMYAPPPPPPMYGGYGPPVQQSGMSPWAAGGLGAAAGGLVGYELGKMEGEREERREEYYDNRGYDNGGYDGGGYGGGGADADFGGGGGGDFGGSGDSSNF